MGKRGRKKTPHHDDRRKQIAEELNLIATARKWATQDAGGRRPAEGTVTCPRCGDRLAYRLHPNGHLHGCCETPGCLWWVE